jgi:hypothetical protein
MELLFILLPGGLLFGLGAAWVVFKASTGRPAWVRSLRAFVAVLAGMAAPVLFFLALGTVARYTQPLPQGSVGSAAAPAFAHAARMGRMLRPNQSMERTATSTLRGLASSAHFQR